MKKGRNTKGNLTQGKLAYIVVDVRSVIVKRARQMKLSAYMIAKLSGVTEQTVRNFLDGTHEMRSDKLGRVLGVLGLEIRPKK